MGSRALLAPTVLSALALWLLFPSVVQAAPVSVGNPACPGEEVLYNDASGLQPRGRPGDDLCVPDPGNPPSLCTPASLAQILGEDRPVKPVLARPPQPITAPLALEPADVAVVGLDFVPDSFVHGAVKRGAALIAREGDFGFSASNGDPEAGHDVELANFSGPGEPLQVKLERFAHNTTFEQAFVDGLRGINRPVDLKFGPDGCAYLVDYGAVRDFGQADPESKFKVSADGPLVQIPGTGVIWKICRQ